MDGVGVKLHGRGRIACGIEKELAVTLFHHLIGLIVDRRCRNRGNDRVCADAFGYLHNRGDGIGLAGVNNVGIAQRTCSFKLFLAQLCDDNAAAPCVEGHCPKHAHRAGSDDNGGVAGNEAQLVTACDRGAERLEEGCKLRLNLGGDLYKAVFLAYLIVAERA